MADERNRKIVELVIDASGVEAGERRASLAYDHLGERAAAAQAKATAAIQQSMRIYENQLPQSIERTAAAYDRLRSKTDPVLAAQLKLEAEMTRSLQVINRAVLQGVTTQQEAEQQVIRLRSQQIQQLDEVRRAQEKVNDAQRKGANDNAAQGRRQNLGYQAFDIGQGLVSGTPLPIIAAQQLPQIAQLYAGQGGVKAALSDVGAIATGAISSIGALPLALGAAGAAAIMYAKSSEVSLKNVDAEIQKHQTNVKALGEAYGVAEQNARSYSEADRAVSRAATLGSLEEQQKFQVQAARELRLQFGSMQAPGKGGQSFFNLFPDYKPFAEAFNGLDSGIRSGRIEGEKFIDAISEISRINPEYEKFSNKILEAAKQFLQINTEITKTKDLLTQIGTLPPLDPLGAFSPERDAQAAADRTPSLFLQQQNRIAALRQESAARSPAEREAAARASAAAQFNASESTTDRDNRIDLAGTQARIAAERQLLDAQRDRAQNSEKMLQDQQMEIDLVGKTGGEVAALRKEYELTSQLRIEAARNGIEVDQQELDLIKQRSQELGRLTDRYNQARFNFDINQQNSDASLSSRDRQIVTTLRQYGLSEDLGGANAQAIRNQLQRADLRESLTSFFTDFRQALIDNGGKLGKALGEAALNATLNALSKSFDKAIESVINSIVNAIFPAGGAGAASSAASAGTSIVSRIFGAANDNRVGAAPVVPVSRAPLGDIASYISNAAIQRGIDPDIALRVARSEGGLSSWNLQSTYMKNGVQEPSFGPYQLYMGGGLGNAFMKKTGLDPRLAANGPAGVDFALDHASKNGWGSWYGAAKAGVGDWQGIGVNPGGAADAVNKLAQSAGAATKGLDTLGGGLGQLGQSLSSSFFPAAPQQSAGGGGGLFGWLSNLFGGAFKPIGAQATGAFTGAFGPGLWDSGGYTGPGGVHDPAGIVHRGEVVWSQADVARAGGVGVVEGMRLGYRGYASGGAAGGGNVVPIRPATGGTASGRMKVDVGVTVENGELKGFVRSIVQEDAPGIAERVGKQQRHEDRIAEARGDFNTIQQQYAKRKG